MKSKRWPVLLIDEQKVRNNVQRMKARADASGCILRPHFKTHQSREIGDWLRQEGVTSITVSSLAMAEYFASAGWKDILIAMPANILLTEDFKALSERLDRLVLMADHPDTIRSLDGMVEADVVVEVDTGSNRSGVSWETPERAVELVQLLQDSDSLTFAGLYSHAGHTYRSRGVEEIRRTGDQALDRILNIRAEVSPEALVFFGDTPYASCGERLEEVDVMTPGNFVFYDAMQMEAGSCGPDDVAICLACPVISVHPERNEMIIHGGAVHLAKDILDDGGFGLLVRFETNGWGRPLKGYKLRAISQEHGVISLPGEELSGWKAGDAIGILPVHSCLTADVMGYYESLDGDVLMHLKKEKPV